MNYDELRAIILNESENVIYISDPFTYDLVYMNRFGMELFNVKNQEGLEEKRCYELLQGKKKPCEFCTNSKLEKKNFLYMDTL